MDVFDLAAKLTLDSSEFEKGLAGAKSSAGSFRTVAKGIGVGIAGVATTIATVGAAAVGAGKAIYDNVSAVAANGDAIDKASQKLSISAEMYQKLAYACDLSGTSIDNLKRGIVNITDDLAAVAAGGEEAEAKFAAVGVSAYDLEGNLKSSEAVMYETLLALADMSDETARNAAANEIFGKSYTELLPLLNSGAEGIAAMMTEAEQFGMVMSDETVKAAAGFNDALTQLNGTVNGVKNNLLGDFLPSITLIMNGFSDLLIGNADGGEKLTRGFMAAVENVEELLPRIFTIVENVVPAAMEVAPKLVDALISGVVRTLPKLVPAAVKMINKITTTLLSLMPQILQAGIEIIITLANGLAEMAPEIIPAVVQTIMDLIITILSNADLLLDAAVALIDGLATGIVNALPVLIQALPAIIGGIVEFLENSTSAIIEAAAILLLAIADAIPTVIIELNKIMPEIIFAIIEAFQNAGPEMGIACLELLSALLVAIPEIIAQLVVAVPEVVTAITDTIKEGFPKLVQNGQESALEFVKGLGAATVFTKIKERCSEILEKFKSVFASYGPAMKQIGQNVIQGLIDGIAGMISKVKDTVTNVADSVSSAFKSFFGIASPSKLFKEFGRYIDEGLAIGLDTNSDEIFDAMSEIQNGLTGFDTGLNVETARTEPASVENNITITLEGEMAELFRAIVKENKSYTKANGRSALA